MIKFKLLPKPKSVRIRSGRFKPDETRIRIALDSRAARPSLNAALALRKYIQSNQSANVTLERGIPSRIKAGIELRIKNQGTPQGYTIRVTQDVIYLCGNDDAGLFYSIQTLRQLITQFELRIPCCSISDSPSLPHRGYYLDISRGKVPKIDTLIRLAHRLAALKINQLQLYVEHVFDFSFDPSIGAGADPLMPQEILELDACCADLHIELVPSLTCFGHMGKILSLPQYRKLAEQPWPAGDWNHSHWIQRLRGATIDPRQPGSRKLIKNMLNEFLPLFSSSSFNMCGDETYDLGKGRNAKRAAKTGIASLYLDHLRFVREIAHEHNKQLMFWGDVMLHYPEAIPDIPKDCIVLDWGYSPSTDFNKTNHFIRAGLEAYVCPSTRGYWNVFNETEEARGNIAGYARTGKRLGANGILTTDWGDMGHFNMLSPSLHGMALGAAMSWNPDASEQKDFDSAFSLQLFGDTQDKIAALFRKAGTTGMGSWPFMLTNPNPEFLSRSRVTKASRICEQAKEWSKQAQDMHPGPAVTQHELAEISLACKALALNAQKVLLEAEKLNPGTMTRKALTDGYKKWSKSLQIFRDRYGETWLYANKPSGLKELQRAMTRTIRRTAKGIPSSSHPVEIENLP